MDTHRIVKSIRIPGHILNNPQHAYFDQDDSIASQKIWVSGYFIPNNSVYDVSSKRLYVDVSSGSDYLTFRQVQILYGIIKGDTRTVIAERLYIGTKGVDFHCERIKLVLGQPTLAKLIATSVQSGLAFSVIEVIETLSNNSVS